MPVDGAIANAYASGDKSITGCADRTNQLLDSFCLFRRRVDKRSPSPGNTNRELCIYPASQSKYVNSYPANKASVRAMRAERSMG